MLYGHVSNNADMLNKSKKEKDIALAYQLFLSVIADSGKVICLDQPFQLHVHIH